MKGVQAQIEYLRAMSAMELVELALTAAAAILCVMVIWTFISRAAWGASSTAALTDPPIPAPSLADSLRGGVKSKGPARIAAALNEVTSRNIFSPPKPEGFQGQIVGIMGDQAVFDNHQTAGVGDTVMGAKILEVGPDWVRIEFEGREQKVQVFDRIRTSGHGGFGGFHGFRGPMSGRPSTSGDSMGESTQGSAAAPSHRRFRRHFHARNGG